jgi:hypothetical protein
MEEINQIESLARLDYQQIEKYPKERRTMHLELMKRDLVRARIGALYVYIDELLANILCGYLFGIREGSIRLWKTKKFQKFNTYIVEEMPLMRKLSFARGITKVTKPTTNAITFINSLRNAIMHSMFPENRRDYRGKRVTYRGIELWSPNALATLEEDLYYASEELRTNRFQLVASPKRRSR